MAPRQAGAMGTWLLLFTLQRWPVRSSVIQSDSGTAGPGLASCGVLSSWVPPGWLLTVLTVAARSQSPVGRELSPQLPSACCEYKWKAEESLVTSARKEGGQDHRGGQEKRSLQQGREPSIAGCHCLHLRTGLCREPSSAPFFSASPVVMATSPLPLGPLSPDPAHWPPSFSFGR